MDAYRDDEHKWVTFCTICGVEEPPMGDECKGYHESVVMTNQEWTNITDWPKPSRELVEQFKSYFVKNL